MKRGKGNYSKSHLEEKRHEERQGKIYDNSYNNNINNSNNNNNILIISKKMEAKVETRRSKAIRS